MNYGFLVTSAINTRFGVYSPAQRLEQTINTINSIKARCPDAHITLLEMSGEDVQPEQKDLLHPLVNVIVDFSNQSVVKEIYKNDNWDWVKNLTEIVCFGQTLEIVQNRSEYAQIDRFFKVSGRYLLNENFNPGDYDKLNKITFARRRKSQFPSHVTGGVTEQFMSRCWSFPASDLDKIRKMFKAMRLCMITIVKSGGYIDIEHLLFLYSNPQDVLEVDVIGVQGMLGPNGVAVRD